jgi:hypothetical protein
MSASDLFWNSSLNELKNGYKETDSEYSCILCGKSFEKGIIYPQDGVLYDALRFIRLHIEEAHGSVFEYLLGLNKKLTGLTEHQCALLKLFYREKSDDEIRKDLELGSSSTIRNHRFLLKEKERQAKLFLAIMELLKEKDKSAPAFLNFHQNATMRDDRYNITENEKSSVLKRFFPSGADGELSIFPAKEKHKLIVLQHIAGKFETGKIYTEYEVNIVLQKIFEDYVTLRRYLIEYGFFDRKYDGSEYWLK